MKKQYKITYSPPERVETKIPTIIEAISEKLARAKFYRSYSKKCKIWDITEKK